MTFIVTCKSRAVTGSYVTINVDAPDADVAIYRAKRVGFDPVSAKVKA